MQPSPSVNSLFNEGDGQCCSAAFGDDTVVLTGASMLPLLKNLTVVLVRAENPVNIGQSARALKNFGVRKLILADCAPHRVPEAYTPGWKARKILDGAKRTASLESALKGQSLAIGFTARAGKRRGAPRPFSDLVPEIMEALKHQKVALVFGNEKNGLSNAEVKKCHWMATIPAVSEYTSLNLSHAVAIVLSGLYMRLPEARHLFPKPARFYTKPEEFDDLIGDFGPILRKLGYRNTSKTTLLDQVTVGFTHYFKKSGLDRRELHLFKAFLARVRQNI